MERELMEITTEMSEELHSRTLGVAFGGETPPPGCKLTRDLFKVLKLYQLVRSNFDFSFLV